MRKHSSPHPTAIAAAAMLLTALPALAQEAPKKKEALDTVVVTGIRASMEKSLQTKRNADAIVDVITAEDVGKLPATNVAEALTTIPGVTIDKAFGQGEKVSILGTDPALNRTLINGQTIASADWFIADQPGRTFNYSLLAPQLINKVEVYKSPEAWLDEGSIGGTVNIATRKPLDQKALTLAASVGFLYNDRIGKGEPTLAGLVGWRNEAKTFGVIFSAQRSEEGIRRDGIEAYGTVKGSNYISGSGGGGSITNLPSDWSKPVNPDGTQPTLPASCVGSCATTLQANPNAVGPNSISAHFFEQKRERDTLSLSLQARASNKLDFEFNALNVKAGYDNRSHSMFAFPGNAYNGLMKMTDLTVDGGVITKGTFKNALMVYDLIDRKATVDTKSYDLKGNYKDDRWFASFHVGASKATGGTKLQVFGEFLNWTDYSYDISSGTPKLNITGVNPLKDATAFQVDGGWGADPLLPTWNTGWGGNIVFKPTVDKEEFMQLDGGLKFDGPIYQLRFGIKHREHNTTQTMGGVSLAAVRGFGDAKASQFSPKQLPGNYLSGFGNVGDLNNRYTIDGEAMAAFITSGKWLAPWQKMPQPATFNDPSFVANTWSVKEVVDAAYLQADYALDSLRGNFGVRIVDTTSNSGGWACTVSTGQACPADKYVPTNVAKNYRNVLPNLNVVYDMRSDLVLRASVAKVMSRPNYGDMSSYLWIGDQTLSGGGGNPNLKPYKSTNLDFSAEWYFAKNAILAGTIFNKKVTDYVLVTTTPEVHYNQFERRNATYAVSRPNNAGSATIKGASLALQANIGWGFGALTNYTFSDAKAAQAGSHLPFNSKHQYSVSPFYESDRFSARVTYTYRSKYYTQADRGNFLITDGSKDLAASASVKLTDQLSLGLDAMNLLDSEYRNYADVAGVAKTELLTRGIYRTGKRYQAVLRYNY